ncbi:MAG: hypothetical protein HQ567_18555 [Candidatus Nealsonbacteria bacterium]|nr:hypothetical protein [Candidatus Nealsonbacteria bacterium]
MSENATARDHLKRIFTENFSVADVAEPLVSFDAATGVADVRQLMDERGYEVVGVREQGLVTGYVNKEELDDGACGDAMRRFEEGEVLAESVCLPTLVGLLNTAPRVFVTSLGRVGGIATRSDLLKPPVRMWLFGMITIIEMGLARAIEGRFPDEGWKALLSAGRLEKAETLLAERKRRNQELDLLDCLQFSDKGLITLKDETLRGQIGYASRNRGEQAIKGLEALRNNLAHAQDIIACDFDTIVRLTENLDKVFAIRPGTNVPD